MEQETIPFVKDPFADLPAGKEIKKEEPKQEGEKKEEPKQEEPKAEEKKKEEPKQEEKKEEPKAEDKKQEELPVEKEWFDKEIESQKSKVVDKTKQEEDKKNEIPADVLKEVERVKKLSENKYNKAVIDLLEKGMTLDDIQAELKGQDPNKMSDKDLFKQVLADAGLSEEEQVEEMAKFDEMSTFQRKQLVNPKKEQMIKSQQEKLKELSTKVTKSDADRTAFLEKANVEIATKVKDMTGKETFGFVVTPDHARGIEDFIHNELSLTNPDGSFNTDFLIEVALFSKYKAEIVQTNITKALNKGKKQVLDEVTRADKNVNVGQERIPGATDKVKKEEKEIDDWAQSWNPKR